jgi:hypothetical protein
MAAPISVIRRVAPVSEWVPGEHNKAAEHQENAAKSHRAAAEQHGKSDHAKGKEYSTSAQQHSQPARHVPGSANILTRAMPLFPFLTLLLAALALAFFRDPVPGIRNLASCSAPKRAQPPSPSVRRSAASSVPG